MAAADVRKYLEVIATWQSGEQIPWNSTEDSGDGGGGSGSGAAGNPSPLPGWGSPIPGNSSHAPSPGPSGSNDPNGDWLTDWLDQIFCAIFGC